MTKKERTGTATRETHRPHDGAAAQIQAWREERAETFSTEEPL